MKGTSTVYKEPPTSVVQNLCPLVCRLSYGETSNMYLIIIGLYIGRRILRQDYLAGSH
ncbi:hypothetical protein [Niallia circulans]|uniref:hypothetical protein n=1 Tax=Niallia circulans TaxID=1397 RepID=UPI002E1CBB07|nr:hypothetical protein [Niallia circulans]